MLYKYIGSSLASTKLFFSFKIREMGLLPIMTPPERGTFFRIQVHEREKILLSIGSLKGPKDRTDEFYGFIKSGKRSIFVIDSYLNDNAFTGVPKGMQSSYQGT